ncbi:TPA: recombinase family protein [Klebsiella pneumoniae]|uniref:recombinase family protein n=1 Tax=Enterobacteriaceae TaxID=543 RepID=UPI000B952754|nr:MULTISPECIES: recombinase family protein [Enterobacteriaceae]EIV9542264.1 recombinase family protein [Klebsiella pneumoniae]EKZ5273390.1 recombinase family protein [Klebsiella pneumoniae]MBC4373510.1 recombinase family protein [Klebsiella pneumoniae]MBP5850827.1 recombinase family protein [Klebsiella variicola]MEC3905253.1 recombinase family protein [Leclercia adecarboxylata]
MKNVRIYCRASTKEQDATRALSQLEQFASEKSLHIVERYVENESGTKLNRTELSNMLNDAQPGDVLLVESTDRLSRLESQDWDKLKSRINDAGISLVIMDLPTTHGNLTTSSTDDVTIGILKAVNSMLIDIMATMAREDYTKRRQRQAQGIARAKAENKYKGRPADINLRSKIESYLNKGGNTYAEIAKLCDCSVGMVAKVKKIIEAI